MNDVKRINRRHTHGGSGREPLSDNDLREWLFFGWFVAGNDVDRPSRLKPWRPG